MPFEASDATGSGAEPAMVALSSDDYAIAWVDRMDDYLGDVAFRTFSTSGTLVLDPSDGLVTSGAQVAPAIARVSTTEYIVAYEHDGQRRGVSFDLIGTGPLAPESTDLAAELTSALQGDVSILQRPEGIWFAWSDARDGAPADPASYRSTFAYLLPAN